MCVVAFAWNSHPRWRLLLAGNRDELHARPSAPLARWLDAPHVVAGRDLEAGGTWMGAAGRDRACVVTNVRDPAAATGGASRGLLASDFLRSGDAAADHANTLVTRAADYHPFNLLLFDGTDARFVSNHPQVRTRDIPAGMHGLANGDLDARWPKVGRATAILQDWLGKGDDDFMALADAFADTTIAPDAELPDTGVGIEMERILSPLFVRGRRYGTRATTVIALDRDGGGLVFERRFGPGGAPQGQTLRRIDTFTRAG